MFNLRICSRLITTTRIINTIRPQKLSASAQLSWRRTTTNKGAKLESKSTNKFKLSPLNAGLALSDFIFC